MLLSLVPVVLAIDGQAQQPNAKRVCLDQRVTQVTYKTIKIDGLDIFYREAGDPSKPTMLLLHGFPTSSHMFRNLMPALADKFHLVAPDYHDQALLDRPGIDEIMLDLFRDYGSNVALYPLFQRFFRARRPPTLIVWGQNDEIFPADGAYAYRQDLLTAELHLLDTGHFALEEKGDEIAMFMRDFLDRWLPRQ